MTTRDTRAARRRALADRRWRAFCRALGYPDPDTITQERTIWPAGATQIATSRICSASSTGKAAVSSPEIRQIVQDVYSQHLALPPEWTPEQSATFLEDEAARISQQIARAGRPDGRPIGGRVDAADRGAPGLPDQGGTAQHGDGLGQGDRAQRAALRADPASRRIRRTRPPRRPRAWIAVRCRGISAGPARSTAATPASRSKTWSPRYGPTRTSRRCFGSRPGYLLAARAEDHLGLPAHREDPLAEELAALVYSDLRHDGLPER